LHRIVAVAGLLLLLIPELLFAADRQWTGASNTSWSTNGNWVGNAPSAGDNALFNTTFTNQPSVNGGQNVGGIWMTTGIGQSVTISGSGTLTLQANTINGTAGLGILVDNSNAFTLTISAGIQIGNAQTWTNSSSNLLTVSGAVNLNNKGLTIGGTGNTTVSGLISNAGAFTKTGTGTLTLSNTSNSYTGQLTVQQGSLSIDTANNASSNGELGNSANSVILGNTGGVTGTLEYTGATASSTKKFTMATGGTGAFQIDSAGAALTLSGIIDGSGNLQKTGAGTLILSGANTYSGTTTVNAGTLKDGASNSIANTNVTVSGTGASTTATLDLNGFNNSIGSLSLGGSTTSSGAAVATGAGTLTLGGNVTYDATNNPLGATISGNLALGATRTFTVGDSSTAANDLTVSAVISGTGFGLTKTGAGTLVLSGANTYTGQTLIQAGTVSVNTLANLSSNSSLGAPTTAANGTIAIGSTTTGATLTYTGATTSTNRVIDLAGTTGGATLDSSGSGAVTFTSAFTATGAGSKTLTLTGSNTNNNTISGAIVDNSGTNKTSLVKSGAGTWVLGGATTFTGTTTVNNGTLTIAASSGSALASTSGITVNSGGTLQLGASDQINNSATMTLNGGTFAKGNFSEGTTGAVGIGALTLSAGSHIDFGTGTVGTLSFASLNPAGFTLTIDNWTGTAYQMGSGSTDRLIFDSDQSANLNNFVFTGYAMGAMEFNLGGGFFEVVAIPESSTWMIGALMLTLLAGEGLRRKWRRSNLAEKV
jgi:autotransporter-associated beta strand protein